MERSQNWRSLSSEEYFSQSINERENGEQANNLTEAPMRYNSRSDVEKIATGSLENDIALEG